MRDEQVYHRELAARRRSVIVASLGAALFVACNALTGVSDLVVEGCEQGDMLDCQGDDACQGYRLCQADGTFADGCLCDTRYIGGLAGQGGGDADGQGGQGNPSGQGGGANGAGANGASGELTTFAICSETAECAPGHACDGEVCRQLCAAAADCDAPGSQCAPPLTVGESFCTANCDIFAPAEPASGYQACGVGVHCLPSANLRDSTDCFYTRGVTRDGAGCARDSECLPGSICVTSLGASSGLCRRLCEPGTACSDGTPCGTFPRMVRIVGREIGICDDRVCDPVSPSRNDAGFRPCLPDQYCSPASNVGAAESECVAAASTGSAGAACANHPQCVSGLGCNPSASAGGACTLWCRTDGDCLTSENCALNAVAGSGYQVRSGEAVGLCVPVMP